MAKLYKININPICKCDAECKCEGIPIIGDKTRTKKVRKEELEILIGSCLLGAKHTKDMKEMVQGFALAREIEKIKEQSSIEVTGTELKVIRKGLELSAGSRPGSWAYCINLFNQIVSPEEIPGE